MGYGSLSRSPLHCIINILVVSMYPASSSKIPWNIFVPYLDGVEELEPPSPLPIPTSEKVEITVDDFKEAHKIFYQNFEKAKEETYVLQSVTSLAKNARDLPAWERTGRGIKWGKVIHRVLEAINKGISDSELNIMIENVLLAEGISLEEKADVLTLINEIRSSSFWKEVEKAEKKYVEVPFSIRLKPADLGLPENE